METIYLTPTDNVTAIAKARAIKSLCDAVAQLGLSTHLERFQTRVEDLIGTLEDLELIESEESDDMSTTTPVVL